MMAAVPVMGVRAWRERRLRRAMRDLPTVLQRQLGEAPGYAPPAELPEGLQHYAAVYRRSGLVMKVIWGLAVLWLLYVGYLAMVAVR